MRTDAVWYHFKIKYCRPDQKAKTNDEHTRWNYILISQFYTPKQNYYSDNHFIII